MVSGSPLGTPASSTTKTGRHDIAETLQKVALNTMYVLEIVVLLSFDNSVDCPPSIY
jgi:hypothetical protein